MAKKTNKQGNKKKVLEKVFKICQKNNDFVFDNNLLKDISKKIGFQNHFDATKLDDKRKLPDILLKNDYALIHLGNGRHRFIKGIDKIYHSFEDIEEEIEWPYRKSLLNQYNSSESNLLSVANNQRILHHFLFGEDKEFNDVDIVKRPKTYFPHRTKTHFQYKIGDNIDVDLEKIQIEIDLTIEFGGDVGIFEAKNGSAENFNIYQLYHPFLYYFNAKQKPEINGGIKNIKCVYLVRNKKDGDNILKLWAYRFSDPFDLTSIKFLKSASYELINKNEYK